MIPPTPGQLRPVAVLCGLALVAASAPTAAAYQFPRYGGAVTAPLPSHPLTYDPARMTRLGEWQLAMLLYDRLTRFDQARGRLVPHLAADPGEPHGLTYQMELRPEVMTHRWRPLRPRDVLKSLQRLQRSPNGWVLGAVRSIRLVGDHLQLSLHRWASEIPAVMASPVTSITPGGARPYRLPRGTGPFRYVAGSLGGPIVLSPHPRHFAGRPYIDRLTLVPYASARDEIAAFYFGRTLLSMRGTRLYGRAARRRVHRTFGRVQTTICLRIGTAHAALASRYVRLAIYLAIDKERLRKLGSRGRSRPAHGPIPPVFRGRRARSRGAAIYGLLPALEALKRARARIPTELAALKRQVITLLVDSSRDRDLGTARKIMTDLRSIGLTVAVHTVGPNQFAATLARGTYALAVDRFTSPVALGRYHLAAAYATAGQRAKAVEIIRARRAQLTRRSLRFMQRMPLIPLYHTGLQVDIVRRVTALRPTAFGLLEYADARVR